MNNILQDIENTLIARQTQFCPFDMTCNLDAELQGTGRSKIHILYVVNRDERSGNLEYFALVQYHRAAHDMVEFVRSAPKTREEALRLILEGVKAAVARNDMENQEDMRLERQSIINRLAELDGMLK